MSSALYSQYCGCRTQALQEEIGAKIRAILTALDLPTARLLINVCLEQYEDRTAKAMQILEEGFDAATAVLVLPGAYRRRLRTTSS